MLSVIIERQHEILDSIIRDYGFDSKARILDVTAGAAKAWVDLSYELILCDKTPLKPGHLKRDLLVDSYEDLGQFDVVFFDPPYLLGEPAPDPAMLYRKTEIHLTGKSSRKATWDMSASTTLPNVQYFEDLCRAVAEKMPSRLNPNGILIAKVLDPRHKGTLVTHHVTMLQILGATLNISGIVIYVKLYGGFFRNPRGIQTHHGYYLIFTKLIDKNMRDIVGADNDE